MRKHRCAGLTLIELAVVIVILGLLVAILLPAIGAARRTASGVQQSTQLRGVHQGMVIYAQGNGSYFPGREKNGNVVAPSVEARLGILLENNYFTGEYIVSPAETLTAWTTGTLTSRHYSYALLRIDGGGRLAEWRETLNTQAIVASDRNTGSADEPRSVWTKALPAAAEWRGTVVYNDNACIFQHTNVLPTRYGEAAANRKDDLFAPAGPDDAVLIHSGE